MGASWGLHLLQFFMLVNFSIIGWGENNLWTLHHPGNSSCTRLVRKYCSSSASSTGGELCLQWRQPCPVWWGSMLSFHTLLKYEEKLLLIQCPSLDNVNQSFNNKKWRETDIWIHMFSLLFLCVVVCVCRLNSLVTRINYTAFADVRNIGLSFNLNVYPGNT